MYIYDTLFGKYNVSRYVCGAQESRDINESAIKLIRLNKFLILEKTISPYVFSLILIVNTISIHLLCKISCRYY